MTKLKKKLKPWQRYQTILFKAHRDGRLTFILRRRDNGMDLNSKMRWNPNTLTKVENRELSVIPKWEMFLQMLRILRTELATAPEGGREFCIRHSLHKLAKEFGMHCQDSHGLIYWYCNNAPYRRVFAWQIQLGEFSERKSKGLLENKAIYRCVIDVQEHDDVKIIPLKRKII